MYHCYKHNWSSHYQHCPSCNVYTTATSVDSTDIILKATLYSHDDCQAKCEALEAKLAASEKEIERYKEIAERDGKDYCDLKNLCEELAFVLRGCSDGNCVLRDRDGGQHTNGGCRCKQNAKNVIEYYTNYNKHKAGEK